MSEEHKRLISEEDQEFELIKRRRLKETMGFGEKKEEMNVKPVPVTDTSFDEIVRKNPLALIDFWADWCGPCRALAPTIEELAKEYGGKVFVGKLNVDENVQTAERFQVYSIPTLIIMESGREVDRIVGCVPKQQIEGTLKKYSGK